MTSLDTATREVISEENTGASKVDVSTRRHHAHRHIASPRRTRDRSRDHEIIIAPKLEATGSEPEWLRERLRDRSSDRIRVRDRSRERSDLYERDRLRLEAMPALMNKDGLRLERDLERRRIRDREIEVERVQRELEDYRRMRRHLDESDNERRVLILEREPGDRDRRRELYTRSDEAMMRERSVRVTGGFNAEDVLRERPRVWSTDGRPHSPPVQFHFYPPIRPIERPKAPDPQMAASSYKSPSPVYIDARLPAHRDRPDDDTRKSSTIIRERRSSSDYASAVPHPARRPRSAFASPYHPDDAYYYDRVSGRERDLYPLENDLRASSLRSNRSDDLYGDYFRPNRPIVVSERNRVIYPDEEPGADRRASRHSSPSLSRPHYVSPIPLPSPPVPVSVPKPRAKVSPPTRALSPAKPASIPTPAAAEPTATEQPVEDIKMIEKLLDFMCPHSPDLVHQNLVKARAKDSGTWLFALPAFEKWQKTKMADDADATEGRLNDCIWLSGNLGAGKTMLMSAVIDHLLASVETPSENKSKKTAVLYYYFDHSTPSSPRDAIASLLRQLCSQKDLGPLPWFLADRLAAMKESPGAKSDAIDTITTVTTDADEEHPVPVPIGDMIADFLSLQLRFDSVYICLDGLEECDDLPALFELLVRLVSSSSPSRLAISARPQIAQPGIAAGIGCKDMVVALEKHNAPDIRSYLKTFAEKYDCLADMIGAKALPEHVRMLAEKSGGNFLAATAETAELNRLTTAFDINHHMNRPSIGFPELFSQIWSRLDDQPARRAILAKRIFYWLSVSRRALTLKELQQAIIIEPEKHHTSQILDQSERLPPPRVIEKVCMGFVRVDTVNNSVFVSPSALPFYFYQFSESFATEAREYAAKCCVGFLHSEILSHGAFKSQKDYDEMERKLPFSRYVAQHWGTHLNDPETGDMHEISEQLLENVPLMDTMSQLLHINRPATRRRWRYDEYPSGFSGRHFAAYFRLKAAFRKWMSPQDWDVPKDSWGRKPLHVASVSPSLYSKHVIFDACEDDTFGVVVSGAAPPQRRTSLASNVEKKPIASDSGDSNSKDFRCEPVSTLPWTWASAGDAAEQLKMLVPFSREEMATLDDDGKTPLHHYIVEWSEDRFTYILNTLYDLQHSSDEGSDAGTDSSAGEVNLLPTLADRDGRTILDYACLRNVVCVSFVFTASAWSSEHISSAIAAAATGGHLWSLKQLLALAEEKFGAEALNLDLKAAVIEASKRGFTDIVRVLRQQGAELSKPEQDKEGMTALHYAAYGSHLDTVRYLLLEGADPNRLDEFGRSPLFCASESGNKGIVSLLIEKGASPNAVNSEGFSSLQLAARNGNLDVVKKLLRFLDGGDRTAKANSSHSGVESKSPLHFAAQYGHNDVVQLLLDEGLPCDSKDSKGRTPLSYACEAGLLSTVKLLLTQKVDVNTRDSSGRTPLSYAAAGGHVDVVVALMGHSELDPNVIDSEARSPLIHAAQQGHGEVVMLLAVLKADAENREAIIHTSGGALSKLTNPPTCHKITDLGASDDQGRTARDYLIQTKDDKAIEFLDTMSAYKAREKPSQPAVGQGEDPDGVITSNAGSNAVAVTRDVEDSITTPFMGRESTQDAGPSNLEAIVVNKIELHPVAEENEDTVEENNSSAIDIAEG